MKPDYTLLDQTAQALGCPLRVDEPMARHITQRQYACMVL